MASVKICGITNLKDAQAAVKLGADALGFVFYKKSPRAISARAARNIIRELPESISKVGVFVDENESKVKEIASFCSLDTLQFHGKESSSYCEGFDEYTIIKAFRIKDKIDIKEISKYDVDAYLFDAFKKGTPGGTGRTFNWELLDKIQTLKVPVILSGGLNHENVAEAIKRIKPYAVDASSSLEAKPGVKNHKLIKLFIQSVKK